jgi:hypothetical protein
VVFAGTPVILFGEVENDSGDHVDITWDGGSMSFDVPGGDPATGEAVRLLRGARLITDWESRYPSVEAVAPLEKRRESRVAARLHDLSKIFGLASREMSLVAVVKRAGDRPGELPETRVVPVGMPQDTAFSAYFGATFTEMACFKSFAPRSLPTTSFEAAISETEKVLFRRGPLMLHARLPLGTEAAATTPKVDLVDLAAMLEPDGGMPGESPTVRAARTIAAILAFVAEGHTLSAGAFRLHVTRLVRFLESLRVASGREARLIDTALGAASTGKAADGQWLSLARDPGTGWNHNEAALPL